MRKLMILGAGPNQIPLIRAAKKNGYHVIVCDYSETAPGVPLADELCLVSIMDKEGVLQAAREKRVDGVISNSEPAMPVVAYVGNAVGVPANSIQTISYMSDKTKFREILGGNDFRVPKHGSAKNVEQARTLALEIGFPLMIKPAASSGSRGVRKMESFDQFDTSFQTALDFSRTDEVILEEYIENHCSHVTGGDIFVLDGQVVFFGLMSCIRDQKNAPLVPMGEMYPPVLTPSQEKEIKLELSRAIEALGVRFGTVNVEIMLDSDGRVFFVELNPRNGGNMIPEELHLATGFDIFGATVTAAMGDGLPEECKEAKAGNEAFATYMVHTMEIGVLKQVSFSELLAPHIVGYYPDMMPGEQVEPFLSADKKIGVLMLRFDSVEQRDAMLEEIEDHILVELE